MRPRFGHKHTRQSPGARFVSRLFAIYVDMDDVDTGFMVPFERLRCEVGVSLFRPPSRSAAISALQRTRRKQEGVALRFFSNSIGGSTISSIRHREFRRDEVAGFPKTVLLRLRSNNRFPSGKRTYEMLLLVLLR